MRVTATVLNVRSGPGTDFRVIHQLREDDVVSISESRGDWVYASGGWVHQAYLAADERALEPPTITRVDDVFGAPCGAACSAGRVTLPAPIKLGWQNASVTRVSCHTLMAPIFTSVFNEIHSAGLWQLLATFDGIYNCRAIKGGSFVSTHSWGISVDLNAATNRQGKPGDMDPRIVAIFEKHGFYWGGRFSGNRRDDMHFEYVKR